MNEGKYRANKRSRYSSIYPLMRYELNSFGSHIALERSMICIRARVLLFAKRNIISDKTLSFGEKVPSQKTKERKSDRRSFSFAFFIASKGTKIGPGWIPMAPLAYISLQCEKIKHFRKFKGYH